METPKSIHIYRHHEQIAIRPIGGTTLAMTPAMAKQLAMALQTAVRDYHDNPNIKTSRLGVTLVTQ